MLVGACIVVCNLGTYQLTNGRLTPCSLHVVVICLPPLMFANVRVLQTVWSTFELLPSVIRPADCLVGQIHNEVIFTMMRSVGSIPHRRIGEMWALGPSLELLGVMV